MRLEEAGLSKEELARLSSPIGLDLGAREDLVALLTELAADPEGPATVMVTHHVEEIPPGITHALLLKQGRIVASGPIEEALTAQNLGAAFDLELELTARAGRWAARAR